ncbi:hypothetical protein ACFX2K_025843 [Malus domestica]
MKNKLTRTELKVFLVDENSADPACDFKVKGFHFQKSCTIYKGNEIKTHLKVQNFVGTVCLKSKKTEIVVQGESAHEVHVEYEEFKTQITALFFAAHSGNLVLVRKLLSYGAFQG